MYFQYTIINVVSIEKLIDEHIPMDIQFEYSEYSNIHNRIEYRTENYYMFFKIGDLFGELVGITLLCNKNYNFINDNISLDQLPYNNSIVALKIKNINQFAKRPYLDNGVNYTISESCKVDVYKDALKISMPNAPEPVFCIMNNDFGVLTDIEFNICSFVLKGITLVEHAYLQDHAKRST